MSFDLDTLYNLLPAIYRIRDLEHGEDVILRGLLPTATSPRAQADNEVLMRQLGKDPAEAECRRPLYALLQVIVEQIGILEDNLAQLYDDQFIETCAEWVVPYIGDQVGFHMPRPVPTQSLRSQVANTVAYRRRKGTTLLLEQLVRDVTGWSVHVVEYVKLLAATQHIQRPNVENALLNVGQQGAEALEWLGSPFEGSARTVDVRNIAFGPNIPAGRGRYNIPNIGIFLWRLHPYPLTDAPAFKIDTHRYLFSPLGIPVQLFSLPYIARHETHLSMQKAVAMPISRGMLERSLTDYYGLRKTFLLITTDSEGNRRHVPSEEIRVSDLSDSTDSDGNPTWANLPESHIVIDPVLGRIAFPRNKKALAYVDTTFHYGFSADVGGGEYHRADSFTAGLHILERVPKPHRSISEALDALWHHRAGGVVEITNCGRYREAPHINATGKQCIELRAIDFRFPLLVLEDGTDIPEMRISGESGSQVVLNGLLISNGIVRVSGELGRLTLRHCTLVPGLSLSQEGKPERPHLPCLVIESPHTIVEIDHCILGALQVTTNATVRITNSIVDATRRDRPAYTGATYPEVSPGDSLSMENSTIIGRVHTASLPLASNTIFLANAGENGESPLRVERRQEGCVRFSYVPGGSLVPRCYHCETSPGNEGEDMEPVFTSLHYGDPSYCQLQLSTPLKIRKGADDESEMGVFHDLFQTQRDINLHLRLQEYLPVTIQPGIIYVT